MGKMKRKSYLIVAILLVSLLVATVFTACGAPKNKEFKDFEKQVLTIAKDNGVETPTEYENIAKASDKNMNYSRVKEVGDSKGNLYKNNSKSIYDMLEKYEDKTEESGTAYKQDVFEQTVFIPLVMGKIINEFYNEKNFLEFLQNYLVGNNML